MDQLACVFGLIGIKLETVNPVLGELENIKNHSNPPCATVNLVKVAGSKPVQQCRFFPNLATKI
jgi:hypothetical protein